ncbi:MAG TPA: hypothetical protein VFS31_00020 [Chitinophagaceae bacterium]|nr:hypothetical protein [Chitinophagaceae bacterium]
MNTAAARIIIEQDFSKYIGVSIKELCANIIQLEAYVANVLPNVTTIRVPQRSGDCDVMGIADADLWMASYF